MRAVITIFWVCVLCCLGDVGSADAAWPWGKKPLMVIDGQEYFAEDYKGWWEYWRDSEDQVPESAQPFVNWMLMVREAERMDLASLPEYKHKVGVFLEARTLMLLKYDEIDSKIELSDAELKSVYDRDYVPRWLIGVLEFSSMDAAKKFDDQNTGQVMDHGRLQVMADSQPTPPFVLHQPQWLRPINTPEQWKTILDQVEPGTLRGPLPFGEKGAILFVAEVKNGDEQDFDTKKDSIKYDLRKSREQQLTEKLVRKLMVKFKVRIDEQVLEKINLADPKDNDRALVVITSDRSTVTVGYFLDQIRKETDITHKLPSDAAGQMVMKRRLANAMVANSVVSWESLARGYEDKEPLRGVYQFYRQNRLVVELESRVSGDIQVADADLLAYYQSHLDEFKRPEMIKGVMVAGEEAKVRKVWSEAISGKELTKAAESHGVKVVFSPADDVPYQHFSETAQTVLSHLKNGDMSQPFQDSEHSVVIKLIDRKDGAAVPFEQVSGHIKSKMVAEKKAKGEQDLVDALRSRSTVSVNDDVWSALAAELLAKTASSSAPAP